MKSIQDVRESFQFKEYNKSVSPTMDAAIESPITALHIKLLKRRECRKTDSN